MNEPSPTNTESVPFLISLLKMGAVFDIEVAKSHAIHHLETHPDLHLTTKLQLCHRFRIIAWLSLTFKALVSQPIESLDPSALAQIPTYILHALIQVKHRIMMHRLTLAAVTPPALDGISCLTPVTCALEWEAVWKEGPAEMLHHPDIFYPGRNILAELESVDISPVCSDCGEMSISNAKVFPVCINITSAIMYLLRQHTSLQNSLSPDGQFFFPPEELIPSRL
ncbi:hypothetical protein F4604DRAFT_1933306 [Suillus subluteus]|nr:hypothetical protein F4604DRAFT_1933306 [Suillus subluteus]